MPIQPETSKRSRWYLVALACCAVAGAATYWATRPAPSPPGLSPFATARTAVAGTSGMPPVMFAAPAFDFVDQHGCKAGSVNLKGHIWVADFIFTQCAGSCPRVTSTFVKLQQAVDDPQVRFVSFSVDPEDDDPATLDAYAHKYHGDSARWILVRPPDRRTVGLLARKMAALARSGDPDDMIMHSDFFILIDADGQVRGLYDTKKPADMDCLKADIARLAGRAVVATAAPAKASATN